MMAQAIACMERAVLTFSPGFGLGLVNGGGSNGSGSSGGSGGSSGVSGGNEGGVSGGGIGGGGRGVGAGEGWLALRRRAADLAARFGSGLPRDARLPAGGRPPCM